MPLPHPHGNGVGQIAHGSVYSETDTPGSMGGRFIGFGEEGTSQIANRAAWALSQNIDWLYQRMISSLASPQYESWAGGAAQYLLASGATVWCGDSGYSAARQLDIDQLFSVLDAQYNQLQDDLGNKVVVKEVRNTGDTQNVVGTGFVAQPLISFQTVDPLTGSVVSASYALPAGTYYILHGRATDLSAFPTDVLTKLAIRVGEELPAGVFLQNGSRKLTGHLDANGKNLTNVLGLLGKAGQDLSLSSYQAMNFDDAYLSTPAALSESGETLVEKFPSGSTSIAHSLNSSKRLRAFVGNRVLNRGGAITFTDGTGAISLPAMVLSLNGEGVATVSVTPTATSGAARVLVYDQFAMLSDRLPSEVVTTDVPIVYYQWNGSAFTISQDIRWSYQDRGEALEVTVGTGCDFTDLADAVEFINAISKCAALNGRPHQIRVIGSSSLSRQAVADTPMTIYGEGPSSNIFADQISTPLGLIAGGSYRLNVHDLALTWVGNDQAAGSAIHVSGAGSIISGVSTSGKLKTAISVASATNVAIRDCSLAAYSKVISADIGSNFGVVSNCAVTYAGTTSGAAGIELAGIGWCVEGCTLDGNFEKGISFGNYSLIKHNRVINTNVVDTIGIYHASADYLLSHIVNNVVVGWEYGISLTATTNDKNTVLIADNYIEGNGFYGIIVDLSHVRIARNNISDWCTAAQVGIFWPAIYVQKPYCVVEENIISATSKALGAGIVACAEHTIISKNKISGKNGAVIMSYGILMLSGHSYILENEVTNCGTYSIQADTNLSADPVFYNEIHNNKIGCDPGIYGYGIRSGKYSKVLHNRLFGGKGGIKAGEHSIVSDNVLDGVRFNLNGSVTRLIELDNDSTLSNNELLNCGCNEFALSAVDGAILVGNKGSVLGNRIANPGNEFCHTLPVATGYLALIMVGQKCIVRGNNIDLAFTENYAKVQYGIYVNGSDCTIAGNIVIMAIGNYQQWYGEGVWPQIYGIRCTQVRTVVSDNIIGDLPEGTDESQNSTHSIPVYGIYVAAAGDCIVTNNQLGHAGIHGVQDGGTHTHYVNSIYCAGVAASIVMGNIATKATVPGTNDFAFSLTNTIPAVPSVYNISR